MAGRDIAGWPFRRVLDPRFRWILNFIDERLGSDDRKAPVHVRLDELESRLDSLLRAFGRLRGESLSAGPDTPRLTELTADLATFLNWNEGPDGFAAQAGLWPNPPAPVEYFEGRVDTLLVNERIVEQPFVFAAVSAAAPPGARVLDVGGAESTVGLSLASLGYEVVLVDPRAGGAHLAHPRMCVRAVLLEDLDEPAGSFDIAIALSAIEHFGLGHYGTGEAADDRAAVERIGRLLKPGGRLVLTVPLAAEPSVDDFQRVYDWPGVHRLLEGWTVVEARAAWRTDRLTWVPGEPGEPAGERGVALLVAERPTT